MINHARNLPSLFVNLQNRNDLNRGGVFARNLPSLFVNLQNDLNRGGVVICQPPKRFDFKRNFRWGGMSSKQRRTNFVVIHAD